MKYYPQIDGLRAVAVLPVVVMHCWAAALPGGGIGVDIFFIISGFVITNILLAEFEKSGAISLRDFYMRRLFRIGPALLAACVFVAASLVAITILFPAVGGYHKLAGIVATLTSTMNWFRALGVSTGGMLGHTWSLSVEEQFYFLWPLLLGFALSKRVSRQSIIVSIILTIVAITVWRAILFKSGASFDRIYNGTDTRIDEILMGCALALSKVTSHGNLLSRLWFIPVGVFGWLLSFDHETSQAIYQASYVAAMMSSAWLVLLARDETAAPLSWLNSAPAQWIGRRSYSLYLWHYPVIIGFQMFGLVDPIWGAVTFASSFVIAAASYRYIELPFNLMRRAKARRPQSTAASPELAT